MGKTGLAISLAETIAKYFEQENISHPDHKKCVLYFSLEDYSVNIVRRLIYKNAGISRYYISRGYITDEDFNKIESETIHLEKLPFYINSRLMRIEDIFDEIENRFQNHDEKPAFIIIDYLQLLSQKRQKQMSGPELIQMIKSFSYEYDIPILVLTNLNPQPETRQDKRPRLTDFSELGESPYVDTVIGVYREYDDLFYEAMTPQKKKTEIDKECEKIKHDMDIFIYESQKSFFAGESVL